MLLTYNSKNKFTASRQNPNLTHYSEDSWLLILFPGIYQFTDLECIDLGDAGPFAEKTKQNKTKKHQNNNNKLQHELR